MLMLLTQRGRDQLREWWSKPTKTWERVVAALAALFFFSIIGVIASFFMGSTPLLPIEDFIKTIVVRAAPIAIGATILAAIFPKAFMILLSFMPTIDISG